MYKNHKNYVNLRNKINEQESGHQKMFDSINEKLQDRSFIQAAIDTASKLESQGPYDRNNNPFEQFRTMQTKKKNTTKSATTIKADVAPAEDIEETAPHKANPLPDTESPDQTGSDSDSTGGKTTSHGHGPVNTGGKKPSTDFGPTPHQPIIDEDGSVPTVEEKPAPSLMTDKEKKCYQQRYDDLNGTDPETHYFETGKDQGRYYHCGDIMTWFMASRYLDRYPELGDKFGRSGAPSMKLAIHHWQTNGTYAKPPLDHSPRYPEEEPYKCADEGEQCKCKGRIHMGMRIRPDNGSEA